MTAAEHSVAMVLKVCLLREADQCLEGVVVNKVFGQVNVQVSHGKAEVLRAILVGGEQVAQRR